MGRSRLSPTTNAHLSPRRRLVDLISDLIRKIWSSPESTSIADPMRSQRSKGSKAPRPFLKQLGGECTTLTRARGPRKKTESRGLGRVERCGKQARAHRRRCFSPAVSGTTNGVSWREPETFRTCDANRWYVIALLEDGKLVL